MKIFSSLLLMLAAILPAAAQSADSDFNGWGIRASLDVTAPTKGSLPDGSKLKLFSSGAGMSVGAVYNYPFAGNFYIEPGASLFYDTFKYSDITYADPDDGAPLTISPAVKKFGVRVPLTVGYRFFLGNDFNFALYTGPEVSCAITGRIGMRKALDDDSLEDNMYYSGSAHKRFDCGWKVGVSVPLGRWVVSLDGTFGLIDQLNTDWSYRNRRLSFSLGYDF